MTDLAIRVRENNRRILRGFTFDDRTGRYTCQIIEGETIKPQLDMSDWLGSETISTVALTTNGGTVTQANSDGIITFTVSAVSSLCDCDALITTSGGRIRKERLRFVEPNCTGRDDYGSYIGT
jgi:type II secretory pathway pseudopilin PulG